MFAVSLPFDGFYCSRWDEAFDAVLEAEDAPDGLWDAVDWRAAREAVAREYAGRFMGYVLEPGETWEFDRLLTPREYNFETDRVFVRVSEDAIRRWREAVDPDVLAEVAADRHTSRSGFVSFYSPDVSEWPDDVAGWDHNQLGTLLLAVLDGDDAQDQAFEDMACNGAFDSAVYGAAREAARC